MTNAQRGRPQNNQEIARLKQRLLDYVGKNGNIKDGLKVINRSRTTYENWRRDDPSFRTMMDVTTGRSTDRSERVSDFAEFRRKFLGMETFPHQMAWVDLLEGRVPSVPDGCVFEPKDEDRILVNCPPLHAKSMALTIDYSTYRICMDPGVKIVLVSKTRDAAKDFLYAIKQRLTHPKYAALQAAYAPEGGFKANADSWTATQIYLQDPNYSGAKDPTVEVLGMGGQIYGARANLIICDDVVDTRNVNEWEKQLKWLRREVVSRLPPKKGTGKVLVIGTRVAPVDLYRELRNGDNFTNGDSPWTYLAQPAVLDFGDGDPTTWQTLWPRSDRPHEGDDDAEQDEDGLYPFNDGPTMARVRAGLDEHGWAMFYQQLDVSEDVVFDPVAVRGSVGMRTAGPLRKGVPGFPDDPEAYRIICSLDPAVSVSGKGGDAAGVVLAVHPGTGRRLVLDARRIQGPTAPKLLELIHDWTDKYRPQEWVTEINGFNGWLQQDPQITTFLAARGIKMTPHYSSGSKNKIDKEFGISSMAPLFGSVSRTEGRPTRHNDDNLIEIPRQDSSDVKSLIEQLCTWAPHTKNKHDLVDALWFADLRAREQVYSAASKFDSFYDDEFTSRGDREDQVVVNIDAWLDGRASGF